LASERKSTDAFETALKRKLQSASPSNAAECPAPEILAAYYDRSLSRSERARVDAHLVACVRCQSMMASMVRADDADRARPPEASRAVFWMTRLLAPVAVVGVVIAIVIGIRTREQRAPEVIALASPAVSQRLELAERGAAPASEAAPQVEQESTIASAPPPAALGKSLTPRIATPHHHRATDKSVASSVANSTPMRTESFSASVSGAAKMTNAPGTGGVGESTRAEQSAGNEIAEEKSEPSLAENSRAQGSTAAAGAAQAPSEAARASVSSTFEAAVTAPPANQISSPDGSVQWQFGIGGLIMRSGNSSPWLAMRSGVTTDLLAASAPSNDVCWVVGKSGTIVRTLDGGAHWQLVTPPSRDNFVAIRATDSNNAMVFAANGPRFITHDGGVTWSAP